MSAKRVVRRQQVLRPRSEGAGWYARVRDVVKMTPVLLGIVFCVAGTTIALYGIHTHNYALGQKIDQPIYAEVDFQVVDEQQTLRRRQDARAATPSYYRFNTNLVAEITTELHNLYQAAQASESFAAFQERTAKTNLTTIEESVYTELRSYGDDTGKNAFEHSISRLRNRLESEFTRDPDAERDRSPASSADVVLVRFDDPAREGKSESKPKDVKVFHILPVSNTPGVKRLADDLAARSGFAGPIRKSVAEILIRRLSSEPLLLYDASSTNDAMSQNTERVEPVTVSYNRNEPMILPRTEQGLTFADLELLAAHDAAYATFIASDADDARIARDRKLFQQLGIAGLFVLITAGLFWYIQTYEAGIFDSVSRAGAFVALLIAALLGARLFDARFGIAELVLGPPLFVASILSIAYSQRFAAGVMSIMAILTVLTVRGDVALLVTLMVGLGGTVFLLDDIRTRTRLIWVGAMSAATIFVSSTAFGLVDGQAWSFAATRGGWAAAAGLGSAMVIQATLPLIERAFRFATSLTLLEWRDTTRPLLQRLAREAPGTYTHSLALGTLAEPACRGIGANGLLAQVGALYHDIGKLNKAAYFAENQEASINRHDNLAPTMSLLIIIGHVKDGLEMAKEYKVPRLLHQFIEEHHGTTVVRYFHHIASEQQPQIARGKHDRAVPESQFRYPGPKPKTKESAVLMLCDGVESAVRSLSDPSPGRIEHVVHQIVTDRLNDGQFDDCDITLRELHRVEESLAKSLCSYYHGRVAYPKSSKEQAEPDRPMADGEQAERTSIAS